MLSVLIPVLNLGLVKWSGLASGGVAMNSIKRAAEARALKLKKTRSGTLLSRILVVATLMLVLNVGFILWSGLASGGNAMNRASFPGKASVS